MHRVAEAIEGRLSVPLLHIADPTAEAINAHGIRTIGLLGTRFTMEQPFYRGRLESKYGLKVLVPSEAERQAVHEIIYQELGVGINTSEARQSYQEINEGLVSSG